VFTIDSSTATLTGNLNKHLILLHLNFVRVGKLCELKKYLLLYGTSVLVVSRSFKYKTVVHITSILNSVGFLIQSKNCTYNKKAHLVKMRLPEINYGRNWNDVLWFYLQTRNAPLRCHINQCLLKAIFFGCWDNNWFFLN
jgi:hypothetical protein